MDQIAVDLEMVVTTYGSAMKSEKREVERLKEKVETLTVKLQQASAGRPLPNDEQLLAWARKQEGAYYLRYPPTVLVMYTTLDRPGAADEYDELKASISLFRVKTTTLVDFTRAQLLDALKNARESTSPLSALIVIIMSHGVRGAVSASDGLIGINTIMSHMSSGHMDGIPKVNYCMFLPHIVILSIKDPFFQWLIRNSS